MSAVATAHSQRSKWRWGERITDAVTARRNVYCRPDCRPLEPSGDVHVAVYDFSKSEVMFSFGTTDGPTGNYTRKACNAPFVRFGMESLWSEKKPADDQ